MLPAHAEFDRRRFILNEGFIISTLAEQLF
jgi:hypothetical protein